MKLEPNELETLRQVFVTETDQNLAILEESLMDLERHPTDLEGLRLVFRAAHTIKGSASLVGLDTIEQFAHRMEDVLGKLREEEGRVTSEVITLLLAGVDALRVMVRSVASGGTLDAAAHEKVRAALADWQPAPVAVAERSAEPSARSEPQPLRRSLRVDAAKLDRLLEVVGEVAVARQGMAALLAAPGGTPVARLRETFQDGEPVMSELRDAVMTMRLVPLGPAFRRLARPVRDVAATTGKAVHLHVEGEEVEVDTAIVDQLIEPLTHLLRNAVDHGIEPAAERTARGKPLAGTITIRAQREGAMVVVTVADDGAGLARARLAAAAAAHGIADARTLSDDALHDLVFQPGFSTAETVTELSGRGVGLDVVRRTVEALRGAVTIASRPGEGTTVTIQVPLTLALIGGLAVAVATDTYLLPMEHVVECLDAPAQLGDTPNGVIPFRDTALPYVALRHLLAAEGPPPKRQSLIVIRHGPLTAGLIADRLLGETETVIRPLGGRLAAVRTIAGSAVLGDGQVALILDAAAILRDCAARSPRATTPPLHDGKGSSQ